MLSPDDRQLFVEAIRPPDGYQFDRGIGTTFTLDLLTLLITPLSLALYDRASVDEALQDPLVLLEGLRRYADRLSIFCQAGYISIPRKENYLYRYLEDMVVEVQAPKGGVFHPKVWLLRYVSEDGSVLYRLLNLSRNLTFDRSWDLILQLDGWVADRKNSYSRNHPLGDFIRTLPELAQRPAARRIQQDIDLMQGEVRKADFRLTYPFQGNPTFYPSGIPGYHSYRFKDQIWRMMVISPFLTKSFLDQLSKRGKDHVLISTLSSIDNLSSSIRQRFQHLYVLDDLVNLDGGEQVENQDGDTAKEDKTPRDVELTGLHAKLFVLEDRYDATWLTGSANATDAAFRGSNVEFMVALKGRKSQIGIDKILGEEDNDFSLRALLRPYPPAGDQTPEDEGLAQAEQTADRVRKWLVDSEMHLEVDATDNSLYTLTLSKKQHDSKPDGEYLIDCWPVSLPPAHCQSMDRDSTQEDLVFRNLSILALTPFIAFQVIAFTERAKHTIRFVLNLPINGIPSERDDYLLGAIIANQQQFLRYLRLLLAGDSSNGNLVEWTQAGFNQSSDKTAWEDLDLPLLEDLIRALSRSPDQKIDRIAEIVAQLRRTPDGHQLIPEDFDALWDKIHAAREILK
jgi:hypothetical protein